MDGGGKYGNAAIQISGIQGLLRPGKTPVAPYRPQIFLLVRRQVIACRRLREQRIEFLFPVLPAQQSPGQLNINVSRRRPALHFVGPSRLLQHANCLVGLPLRDINSRHHAEESDISIKDLPYPFGNLQSLGQRVLVLVLLVQRRNIGLPDIRTAFVLIHQLLV